MTELGKLAAKRELNVLRLIQEEGDSGLYFSFDEITHEMELFDLKENGLIEGTLITGGIYTKGTLYRLTEAGKEFLKGAEDARDNV